MDTSSPEFQEALRDHARSLGVDPDSENYLLPLVQEALLAELPPDWEQGETEDGTLYYFNSSTEESIWEHPLDAHYRELIQAKKDEHAAESTETINEAPSKPAAETTEEESDTSTAASKAAAATNSVDVYSFDDSSDEEAPTPVASPAPVSSKSRISDLFATPTVSMPARKAGTSTGASVDATPVVVERPQTTPAVSTGFGFGRDRSWLLDNDDDVSPVVLKPTPLSTQMQASRTDSGSSLATSRMGSFGSRRAGASATSTTVTPSSIASTPSTADVVTPLTSSQSSTQRTEEGSRRPSSIASAVKGPFSQHTPAPSTTITTTASAPSPTTMAEMQQLEKKLADATRDLEREKAAHSETTRQLQTAQQEAKESNYLKMKVTELKAKLSEQESAASTREKQQLDKHAELERSASEREKQQAETLAKVEAENARLVKQQGQTQSQELETHQKEAQQSREALENKQAELERLQKRLSNQEEEAKAASNAHAKAQAESQQQLDQQVALAEAASRQHVTEIAALREQLEKVEQQHRALKSTADEQATKCERLEKLQQELRTLKSTAGEQATKCEQLEKLQQELRTLKATADEQAARCEQLGNVQDALAKQERRSREAEEKSRGLQAQLDRVQQEGAGAARKHDALVRDLEAKRTESSTLQSALQRAQDELRQCQDELRKAQDGLRAINSSFEQQRHQQQVALERERITADAEAQAQSRVQRLQTQLNAQLDEQTAAKAKLQAEVIELRGELASVQAQEVKPLEKLRDQLQREVDRLTERTSALEKELRSAKLELSGQTDRANQLEIEVDVLARREQQRKAQTEALTTAKNSAEKQLATLQDELLTAQHDRRVDTDKLSFRVRELEGQLTQKEYEAARLEERFAKAEAWRAKEAARVEKRDAQLMELREQLTALQARHVEVENSAEVQELRASKQKAELRLQKLERELSEERDARKRDEVRRTEELQRMQQAVEWQLPQLAQACVTRSSDEWARKCRAVAKKLRDELSLRALQERNELVAREQKAHEACERAEQKIKTAVAESEFLRREVSRLEDNNKVLLEQLHTIRVYLTQRQMPSQVSGVGQPPWGCPAGSTQHPPAPGPFTAAAGGAPVPLNFSDFSTVNQLNTQLGILHAQFQQLFDSNERRRAPSTSFSPSDRFEIPGSPTASVSRSSGTPRRSFEKEDQRREADAEDAEIQRLAMDALMDQKLATSGGHSASAPSALQRQQEELLTTLESLGDAPDPRWLPVSPGPASLDDGDGDHGHEPHSTLWYQQDYWRRKYQ
jgi:chromosome segregation ATPase